MSLYALMSGGMIERDGRSTIHRPDVVRVKTSDERLVAIIEERGDELVVRVAPGVVIETLDDREGVNS